MEIKQINIRKKVPLCGWQQTFTGIIFLVFMFYLVPAASAYTYLPFDNKQTICMPGADDSNLVYKTADSGFMVISYKEKGFETGDRDIVLQKVDKEGKRQWEKTYAVTGDDELVLFHQCSKGYLLVIKSKQSVGEEIKLLKIDGKGEKEWQRKFAGKGVNSVANTNDDGFIIAGYKESSATGKDIYIVKADEKGLWKERKSKDASRWEKTYTLVGDQEAAYIQQLVDEDEYNDGYVLTGYTDTADTGAKDAYLIRLDAYGKKDWEKTYGGKRDDEGKRVIPIISECSDELLGFFVVGYTRSQGLDDDKDMYLIHTDKYGYKKDWYDKQRAVDGKPEKYYGGSKDETAFALYEVPEDFEDERKLRGEDIPGSGGIVLVGIRENKRDSELVLIRIDWTGRDLWKKTFDLKGNYLYPGEFEEDENEYINLVYNYEYPTPGETTVKFHTLKGYLAGVLDEDKTVPQDDQLETNREEFKWETQTFKYLGYIDRGKEIKELLSRQKLPPLATGVSGYGKGRIDWPDTSYYLGKLYLGKADGNGTLVFPDGTWYQGEWKDNMFNGKGKLFFPTGEYYEGTFKDHTMHGKGVFCWPTGEKYEGEFKLNKRDGKGVFTWPGGVRYEGDFAEDEAEGMGKIVWPNGEKYEGEMKKGQATGQGIYYFINGEHYRGEFKNLAFEGVGAYYWPDGGMYVGEFKNDRLEGQGYYIWPNGVKQWGYWKEDRYIGIHPEADCKKGK